MATKSGAKKGRRAKGGAKKPRSAKGGAKKPRSAKGGATRAASTVGIPALAAMADDAQVNAQVSSSQCIVWRFGEFRARVRQAVADWAGVPVTGIAPTNTLSELAAGGVWNVGEMAQLVSSVNATKVFEPPFPGRVMQPPDQLVPGSMTVLQWEGVVWKHQSPLTPCFAFTD